MHVNSDESISMPSKRAKKEQPPASASSSTAGHSDLSVSGVRLVVQQVFMLTIVTVRSLVLYKGSLGIIWVQCHSFCAPLLCVRLPARHVLLFICSSGDLFTPLLA